MVDMKARAVIEAVDRTGKTFDTIASKMKAVDKAAAALAKMDKMAKMGAQVDAVAKAITKVSTIDAFRGSQKSFVAARTAFRDAQANVARLSAEMTKVGPKTAALGRDFARAQREVKAASSAFEQQKSVLIGHKRAMEQAGVPISKLVAEERRLKSATEQATAALNKRHAALQRSDVRRQALGSAAAIGGMYLGYRARQFGKDALDRAKTFDTSLRHQRFATDISEDEQRRVLVPQAERIGQDTKFTNEDVVRAQTEFANGLPAAMKRADVLKPVIEQAKNYALTLKNVDMSQAAMAVRGYLLSLGKDISTPENADKEARSASNKMIRASKIGGMEHEDLMHLIQRGGSAARLIGLTDETILALGVGMKRSNISGDQAGTALRTLGAKLANPTNKGMAAMATAGIDYSDYTKLPGGMSVANFEKKFKQDFGKSFTPKIWEVLAEAFEDEDIFSEQGSFAKAVTDAVSPLFGKTKKGTLAAKDAQAIAKKAGEFHKFAVEAVDAEKLLLDILAKDPSLGVLNALMTDKHGNKFGLLAKGFEQFMKDRADLKAVPSGYGDKAAALLQGGLEGAINQVTGGVETLKQRLGSENEYWLTPFINRIAGGIDSLTELVKKSPTTAAVLGGAGATAAGIGGTFKFINDMFGGNAPALALTASASALGGSAAALTAAAARLGIAGLPAALPGAPPAATAATAATSGAALGRAAGFATVPKIPALVGAALAGYGIYTIGEANRKRFEGVEPGEVHNQGRNRRRAFNEALHLETQNLRATVEGPIDVTVKVDAELTGSLAANIRIQVDGPGHVTGMSVTSSTPLISATTKASLGRSMPQAGNNGPDY